MSNPRVTRFNFVVGNEPQLDCFFEQVEKQAKYLLSEAQELLDAAQARDIKEVLDGHLDVRYVNEYIEDLLAAQSVKVKQAWAGVCDNNDTKFSTSYSLISQTVDYYAEQGVACYIAEVDYEGVLYYTCRRSSDDKVMKPITFEAVDLTPFIPKSLLEDN